MYISITIKNILQIFLGTLFNYSEVAKPYRLINLNKEPTFELKKSMIELIFLYDFILFVLAGYFWVYVILYIIIALRGNKSWVHLLFFSTTYMITVTYFDPFNYNIFFIIIVIILGYVNYLLFDKWVKFE